MLLDAPAMKTVSFMIGLCGRINLWIGVNMNGFREIGLHWVSGVKENEPFTGATSRYDILKMLGLLMWCDAFHLKYLLPFLSYCIARGRSRLWGQFGHKSIAPRSPRRSQLAGKEYAKVGIDRVHGTALPDFVR